MLLLEEIKQRLAEQLDEVDLLEYLNVNSFELVERFSDKIEDNIEYFEGLVDDARTEETSESSDDS